MALIFPKFRNAGLIGVIAIHVTILLVIGPFGADVNSVVWPWNIAMICLAVLGFYRQTNKIFLFAPYPLNIRILNLTLVVVVWVLPSLNFFKMWDNYLSFSLYSGKVNNFYIAVDKKELEKLDKDLYNYFVRIDGLQGGAIIDVQRWSIEELNVPFTGQGRVFKNVSRYFCSLGIDSNAIYFLEVERTGKVIQSLTCKDLRVIR